MACGSCGGAKKANVEYEVTFPDGRKERFQTSIAARLAAQQDTSVRVEGSPRAPSVRAVAKISK